VTSSVRAWPAPGFLRLARGLSLLMLLATPLLAQAWWNADFKQRTRVVLNTGAAGVATGEGLANVAVPVRLHSGNYDFIAAKPDGSDLRVLAGDDKTPLAFWVERFDGVNELAVVWVAVPAVATGETVVFVYAGNPAVAAQATQPVFDAGAALSLRFAGNDAALAPGAAVTSEPNGLIGPSARFDAPGPGLELPAPAALRAAPGAAYSLSLWIKPAGAGGTLYAQGPLALVLEGTALRASLGSAQARGGELPPSAWAHVAVTVAAGRLTLYVDGAQAAQAELPANTPAIEGPVRLADGFAGQVDEVQAAPLARTPGWIRFTRASQGADAKLVASELQQQGQTEAGDGGHGGYIGVLVKNLTIDAWVVIVILALMFVVACWVMVDKTRLVLRTDRGNREFLQGFRAAADVMGAEGPQRHGHSSLARLYEAGLRELKKRNVGNVDAPPLSGASLDAVKASVDADLVRENHRLNSLMVLLTIAISGGPFLGLLGTVVGVMITFAAIAAAGDVNVNAIAPGIAAALLATVAGLGVAIPALFGYNWLASRIKNISADMQIFVDEFVTRVAERYGER
jgi:biopolymer transport protein ExbB